MADIESNVRFNIDASGALQTIKNLQRQISAFHTSMSSSGVAANTAISKNLQRNLIDQLNATGKFTASITNVQSTTESFTASLEKNKFSMGEYFRYAGGATRTFGKLFTREMQTIEKVAIERVKTLQTQYIQLGRDASGALQAMAIRPAVLDMDSLATKTAVAAQKQQLFNQLLRQGSTNLLNFGKNTQWAGRQLMVGFTIPLTIFATTAAKTFMDVEKQAIRFKRVYGDAFSLESETDAALGNMQRLASEFTKYGVQIEKTLELAADAAAMGLRGAALTEQVTNATRLAVLGEVEQQEALEATISVTNAFGVATEDLASKINFLNAVENETVTAISDLTIAIPKAGPVVKQLGGDVEDLAFFLTAMKEGGINASEGANALKSGLASLINPTDKASQMLSGLGINIKGIVEANKGDVKNIVIDFARALDTLDPLNRARAIEQLFGKFQFSRLSTLFQNVIKQGTQAEKVLQLTQASSTELAILAERELKRIEQSTGYRFQKAIEDIRISLVPLGEAFLKAITPFIHFATDALNWFNKLDENIKNFAILATTAIAGIGPVVIMTFGLLSNGLANIIKMLASVSRFFMGTGNSSKNLATQTEYLTQQQLENATVAASLEQVHARLTQSLLLEASAAKTLTEAYRRATAAQGKYGTYNPAAKNFKPNLKLNSGIVSVPGPKGAGDIVPAMLSPGEAVIPAKQAQKYSGFIQDMIAGNVPEFRFGAFLGMPKSIRRVTRERQAAEEMFGLFKQSRFANQKPETYLHQLSPSKGFSFPIGGVGGVYIKPDGSRVFVKPMPNEQAALAEIRGTQIARQVHGLQAPEQRIVVIKDPTDYTGRRKFLALESPLNPTFATTTGRFSKKDYIKQLVASSLRGDKDLSIDNVFGSVVADVGPAGVMTRASGIRGYAKPGELPSMEQQAIINLLGVKGGAKKAFAQATSDIARSMTGDEFATLIRAEIRNALPKLRETVRSFNLVPEEKIIYQAMIQRLEQGLNVDWKRVHSMHTQVPYVDPIPKYAQGVLSVPGPKGAGDIVPAMLSPGEAVIPAKQARKYAGLLRGIVSDNIPGYEEGYVEKFGRYDGELEGRPLQKAHLGGIVITKENAKKYLPYFQGRGFTGNANDLYNFAQKYQIYLAGQLTADLSASANQALSSNRKGLTSEEFDREWNGIKKKLYGSAVAAGLNLDDPKILKAIDKVEAEIGKEVLREIDKAQQEENKRAAAVAEKERAAGAKKLSKEATARTVRVGDDPEDSSKKLKVGLGNATDRVLQRLLNSKNASERLAAERFIALKQDNIAGVRIKEGALRAGQAAGELESTVGRSTSSSGRESVRTYMGLPVANVRSSGRLSNLSGEGGSTDYRTTPTFAEYDENEQGRALRATPIKYGRSKRRDSRPSKQNANTAKQDEETAKRNAATAKRNAATAKTNEETSKAQARAAKIAYDNKGRALLPGVEQRGNKYYVRTPDGKLTLIKGADAIRPEKGAAYTEGQQRTGRLARFGVAEFPTGKSGRPTKAQTAAKQAQRTRLREAARVVREEQVRQGQERRAAQVEEQRLRQERELARAQQRQQEEASRRPNQLLSGKMAGRATAVFGMAGVAAAGASFIPGPIGEMANQLMMPLILLAGVMPMLMNKFGGVLAAITAVIGAMVMLQVQFDETQKKTIELANATKASNQAMTALAEFGGRVTATEIMSRVREERDRELGAVTGKQTFGEAFVQSEGGKALTTSIANEIGAGRREQAISNLSSQMTSSVLSGALSFAEANSIAANIASELNDMEIGIRVNAQLEELLGPNGNDLLTDPLGVRLRALEQNQEAYQTSLANAQNQFGPQKAIGGTTGGRIGAVALGAGVAAGTGALIGSAILPGIGTAVGAILGTIAGAIGTYFATEGMVKEAAKLSAAAAVDAKIAIEQNQQLLDSMDLYYQKKIEELRVQGKINEAEALQNLYMQERGELVQGMTQLNSDLIDSFNADPVLQEALTGGARKATDAAYADNPDQLAYIEVVRAQMGEGQLELGGDIQYLVELKMAAKELPPGVMRKLLGIAAGSDEAKDAVVNIITKFTGDTAGRFGLVASYLDEDTATNFTIKVSAMEEEEAADFLANMAELTKLNGIIPAQLAIEFYMNNPEEYAKFNETMDEINAQKPKTIEALLQIVPELQGDIDPAAQAYFDVLSDEQKQVYVKTLVSQLYVPEAEIIASDDYKKWLQEDTMLPGPDGKMYRYGGVQYAGLSNNAKVAYYRTGEAFKATMSGAPPAPDLPGTEDLGGSGGAAKQTSSLDDLLKKLRDLRLSSVKASEGWKKAAKTLEELFGGSKTIKGFNGLAQQLRALGGSESFIEFILGMPPEEFEKQKTKLFKFDTKGAIVGFKDLASSVMEALNAIKLGEFQNEQQSIFQNVANQFAAVNKLIQSGVSLADAYDIVQDAALASAIAHEENSETLKLLAQDIKAATAATKRFAAAQALAGTVQETIDQGKILNFIQKNMGIMNNDIIQGILDDPELQQLILLGGDLTGEEADLIKQRLQQILDNAKLELEIKKLTIEGMEEIFNDGFDKAMEAFNAQEKAIEIEFDLQTQADQDIIQNAEEQIALINYQIDDYEASLREIEEQEVEVNKKYDDRIAALNEVQKANEAITAQQKAQLTIADAITQGDMFAAAKAIEDLRAEEAQKNIQSQQDQLNNARQVELDELRTKSGLTREEIEKRIKDLQDQIFQIEENSLEPAQERIRLATIEKEEAIEQLRVLGLTREEWEAIQNRIDLARTSSDSYTEAITEAKNIVEDIVNYWEELDGKEVNVTQIITTIRKEEGSGTITTPEGTPVGDGSDGSGGPDDGPDDGPDNGNPAKETQQQVIARLRKAIIDAKKEYDRIVKLHETAKSTLADYNKEVADLERRYDAGDFTQADAIRLENLRKKLIPSLQSQVNSLGTSRPTAKQAWDKAKRDLEIYLKNINSSEPTSGSDLIMRATGGRVPRNTKPEIWSSAGGAVNDFAAGKYAQGTDTVPAMLTPGEYVVNARAVSKLGTAFLNKVNTGNVKGLAMGGAVNEQAPQVATVGSHFEDRLINGEVDKLAQGGLVDGKIQSDRPQVPVRFPISGGYAVSSPFGSRNGSHYGVDLVARPAGNVPIRAAEPGRVTAARKSTATGGGYGQYVKLLGQSGTEHIFAHLQNTPLVSKGELISVGRMLGRMGMTGNATGTHLHWETRKGVNGKRQDPMGWIRRMQESGVAPKPYQPFGVKGTYNGEVRQKSGYYYTWSVPQQKWIKGARVPASAAIAKPNTGSGTLPPASNNRPPQMLALGGLVGPMIDGGGQKFAPFGKAGSYPGQIKAYAGYNYSWNIGTQKWVKGSKVPVASQNTTQAAITAMQQDKQIVSQGTAPTYPPFGKVGKAGEVRKYGGYYYSWNNSSRKWVKGVKVLTTPEQTIAQAQEQLMQQMQDSYMSMMDVAIDPRTGQVMGFGEMQMPTTSFEQLPPALQLEAFRNSRNYDNMLVSYQIEMQKKMQEEAKAEQDALYRQGGFQGFEAGFQGFMADTMAYLDSDKGTILGAKVTDILANPFVQGIGAVLSIPAELVGGLVQKGLATANLAKQGDWLNALLMGTLGFELSGQYGAPGLQALANPFVNAFGGGDGKTMFERAALTGIDLFGTENDPEMAALARIIGGTLNLVGDPLNYVGAGLISKAAGIGKLGNAAKNLIAKMDARGMLNNRGAISVVPQKPNNRVDIGTQEVEFGDKLVTSYLLGDNTKPIVFQGYKRKPHEDPIGDNLGLDYSDLERNGIDIVGTRPDELIDAAIRLNPNNPNNAKLKQMQENIQNGIFETDELELLDNINAAILLDNSGLPIPLKVGSIPVQDINPAGFALVLKSLMGDQIASNILNFRRNKFLEIIASHPLRSARQKATYVTGEGPKLVDLSPQQQLDEFLNPSNSNPFDQSIYPTEVLSQIANTSLDPSKVSLIHSVKPQYGITRDKNGNVVLNPSGRYLYKDREVRSSIHFSLDSPVQSHALGTWGHTNRKIVTPLSSAIDESGFPYALNPEDTWWMRNPGQPMIFKNASVIHPFTNIQEYAAELVKRGLIREGEIPPLIAVDPNTRDILHIFKESYTDADSALLTQIFKDTGLYNREKHFSGIAPDIETIDEAALALAKKQIGADIVPIRNREISEGYASKDQMFNALIEKFRLEQNLYKNANMTVGLHTFLRAGRFETIGGAARRGATMHDSIEAYRYAALSGHFQPDVRYLDSSPLLSSTKTFTAPSVGAKGLNNRGSISPELALWFLPPKIRAKLLARADGNNPRLAGKSKIADMLLNRAKRRVPPLDRELMDELAYLNPRWNVLKESGLDGLTPADVQDLIKDLPKVYDFRKTSGSSYRKYKYAYAQVQAFNAQIAKNNLNELTPDAAERALLENESLEIDFPGQEDIPSGLFGRELMDADTAALGLRSFNLNAFNTWFSKQVRGTFRQFPKLYKDRFRKQAQDFIDGYDSTIVNPDNPFGMVDNRKMQMYDSVLGLVDPDAAQAMGLDLAGRGLLPLRRTEFDQSVAQPKFLDLFLDSQYLQDDLTTFLQTPIAQAMLNAGDQPMRFRDLIRAGLEDTRIFRRLKDAKNPDQIQRFATGGEIIGSDTIPAMLTPGEYVVRRSAVNRFGKDFFDRINNGTVKPIYGKPSFGIKPVNKPAFKVPGSGMTPTVKPVFDTKINDSVYNYSINVNVRSDANPDQIARSVMSQIKQIDSMRMRGNRF